MKAELWTVRPPAHKFTGRAEGIRNVYERPIESRPNWSKEGLQAFPQYQRPNGTNQNDARLRVRAQHFLWQGEKYQEAGKIRNWFPTTDHAPRWKPYLIHTNKKLPGPWTEY